jgi:hypothetical protein
VLNGTTGSIGLTATGTNQNISLTPTGTGTNIFNTGARIRGSTNAAASGTWLEFITADAGNSIIRSYDRTAVGSRPLVLNDVGGNVMLGTGTDLSTGRLQIASHSAKSGGIGFNTGDVNTSPGLFSSAANNLVFGSTAPLFSIQSNGTAVAESRLRFEPAGAGASTGQLDIIASPTSGALGFGAGAHFTVNNLTNRIMTLNTTQLQVIPTTASTSTTTGALTVAGGLGVAGAGFWGGAVTSTFNVNSVQSLSGAGAVDVTNGITEYTSTGGAQALTLANGTAGQIKRIVHGVDGGSGVLTPTTKTGYTTITFTNAGDSVTLVYLTTRGWCIVGIFGAVAA